MREVHRNEKPINQSNSNSSFISSRKENRGREEQAGIKRYGWYCSKCTFWNKMDRGYCEMCASSKGNAPITENKEDMQERLVSMGFKLKHVTKSFKEYEEVYGRNYDIGALTEIIVRLQTEEDKAKLVENSKKRGSRASLMTQSIQQDVSFKADLDIDQFIDHLKVKHRLDLIDDADEKKTELIEMEKKAEENENKDEEDTGSLRDEPKDDERWGFNNDFRQWTHYDFLSYLVFIDIDQKEDLADWSKFSWIDGEGDHVTGNHFTKDKLGNAKWCADVLQLNERLSRQLSAIIRQRIQKYEDKHPTEAVNIFKDHEDVK